MPTEAEFDRALDEVADFVRGVDDEVLDEDVEGLFEYERGERSVVLKGHRCSDGDSIYAVVGNPDLRAMTAVYYLSVTQNVGAKLDSNTVDSLVEDDSLEGEQRSIRAGELLLNRLSEGKTEALINYAYFFVAGGAHNTQIYRNDEGAFTAFSCNHQFFPYERDFGISKFHKAVQETVIAGKRGNRLLSRTITIQKDEEDPSDSELEIRFTW